MKKLISAALIAAALATGVAFAQEEEAPAPEWKVSGVFVTGLHANIDQGTWTAKNTAYGNNRLRVNANYTNGNFGIRTRAELASAKQWGNTINTTVDIDSASGAATAASALTLGLRTPQLVYAYGWADLLDGALSVEAGRLFTNPVGANFFGYGMYGNGARVTYTTPVEGLSATVSAYVPGTSYTADLKDMWKDSFNYGVAYSGALFSASASFGYDSCYGNTGAVLTCLQLYPVDQLFLYAETDVFGLLDNAPYLEAYGEIDLSVYDPLAISLYYTVNADLAGKTLDFVEVESEFHYTVTDTLTADFYAGADLTGGFQGFYVMPGVTYKFGRGSNIKAAYSFGTAESYLGTSGSAGNEVIVDFQFAF